jgi:3'-5' exoribonuclease 1
MRWRTVAGRKQLVVVDTYRSFVKPTWKPQLSEFCTRLTGVTQVSIMAAMSHFASEALLKDQVDQAPTFIEVTRLFAQFLAKHGLIDSSTGQRLVQFCWCSDGPYDIRDFVAKQCFISQVSSMYLLHGPYLGSEGLT